MPTESTFLLAGLFFLAAALGYFFARYGDDEDSDEAGGDGQLNADYVKGLNYLLNEQSDEALEVFMRTVAVDAGTLETHFALGSLFRRRGEIDRAIKVHENIIARPNLSDLYREQALVALAEDYMSAGLLDRAEQIFRDLRQSQGFTALALERLLRIYEVSHDWQQAIETCTELERISPDSEVVRRRGHYFCELAELALVAKDFDAARNWLNQVGRGPMMRARLLLADLYRNEGEFSAAAAEYREIGLVAPGLLVEIVSKLAECCRELGDQALLSRCLSEFQQMSPASQQAIAFAVVRDERIENSAALECLRAYVLADEVLSPLVDTAGLTDADLQRREQALQRVRRGLLALISQANRYRCNECGYVSSTLLWHCPGCRSWEAMAPVTSFSFSPSKKIVSAQTAVI